MKSERETIRPLLDFVVVGAMKCGTTSLAQLLAQHPQVCFCREKEPHYFANEPQWRERLPSYHGLFAPESGQVCGEASTTYTMMPRNATRVWQVLHDYNPKLKILYVMRHPIDRITSHYMHGTLRGFVSGDLPDVLQSYPGLLAFTRYWSQIRPYVEKFGPDQVLLLRFEEFVEQRSEFLAKVASFLNIGPAPFREMQAVSANVSVGRVKRARRWDHLSHRLPGWLARRLPAAARPFGERPTLANDWQQMVLDFLEPEVKSIEQYTGWDLNSWRKLR